MESVLRSENQEPPSSNGVQSDIHSPRAGFLTSSSCPRVKLSSSGTVLGPQAVSTSERLKNKSVAQRRECGDVALSCSIGIRIIALDEDSQDARSPVQFAF